MKCDTMLEAMLDAEPRELAGDGVSALAAHIRMCARCRAVANALIANTTRLAAALGEGERRPAPRRLRRERIAAGAVLAAAILLLVATRRSPAPASARAPVEQLAAAESNTPQVTVAKPRVRAKIAARVAAGVEVTPPAGVRATVIQTSNPKITVVWLY